MSNPITHQKVVEIMGTTPYPRRDQSWMFEVGKTRKPFFAIVFCFLFGTSYPSAGQDSDLSMGEQIWKAQCATCHGDQAEGVPGRVEHPLVDLPDHEQLATLIEATMPPENPTLCVGREAREVAGYLLRLSGSVPATRETTRMELLHLNNDQFRIAVANLFDGYLPKTETVADRGLRGTYFNGRSYDPSKKVAERVDQRIDFNWGNTRPINEMNDPQEFCVVWEGSIFAEVTGTYRFVIQSPNGFRLYVNRLDQPLINNWVTTVNEPEKSETAELVGGRWYAIKLEMLKVKDPEVRIQLLWETPAHVLGLVPQQSLMPIVAAPTILVQTPLPPDDSSMGFRRGSQVSAEWEQATLDAAIATATEVAQKLSLFIKPAETETAYLESAKRFCREIAVKAFRRRLEPPVAKRYIDDFFEESNEVSESVRNSLAAILKSPFFLYCDVAPPESRPNGSAERFCRAISDSLPDRIVEEWFANETIADSNARLLLGIQVWNRPESKAKWEKFFLDWFQVNDMRHLNKDPKQFVEFDRFLVHDLQASFIRNVDDVIWNEPGDFRQLFRQDDWWVNSRLANFYEIAKDPPEVAGSSEFFKVPKNPSDQAGILTHPLLMSQLAYFRSSSPIYRGVFISKRLLGIPLKPPPVAVEPLAEDFDLSMTTRQRVEHQTNADGCMTCHRIINPLGFALESLDAVGKYRTFDKAHPVNTLVELTFFPGETVALSGPRDLAEFLVTRRELYRNVVRLVLENSGQQPSVVYTEEWIEELTDHFIEHGYNFRDLVIEVAWRMATLTTSDVSE